MGGAKRYQEFLEARGYEDVEGHICLSHILDPALKSNLSTHSTPARDCRLCEAAPSNNSSTIPIQEFQAEVMEALRFLYEPPDDAGVPWDDGYQGAVIYDTWEAVYDICSDAFDGDVDESLIELLTEAISEPEWTHNRHASSLDAARWEWDSFVTAVRTESRFIFMPSKSPESVLSPGQRSATFLWSLLPYVENAALGLLQEVPAGTAFFRGRLVNDAADSMSGAKDLGPAPASLASANRMSPEGIPMFYASAKAATAVREIAAHGNGDYARIGTFRNQHTLTVLDLTGPLTLPSIYDRSQRDEYGIFQFFRDFSRDITAPLLSGSRPHIEYAPTQIVTEFFRWVPETKIDGIKLNSAQDGQPTYVLFYTQNEVEDAAAKEPRVDELDTDPSPEPSPFDLFFADPPPPVLTLAQGEVHTYRIRRRSTGIDVKLVS
ncbi:hypothetical protein J2Y41_004577 [Arthrobacter sp. 1088]|uniref:HEPN-associated N-terminal domain-containing protein n=1 Tax=Arthrobacter sp. 1088 TaxID=2817768 RepID=UPI00285DFC25|nr:HEPN-associated N-terminal domain-containing protein [Arthrobacter sp. 1088]MDR6688977.1 hypothetical protein [Arthrobacter sp. 1088]